MVVEDDRVLRHALCKLLEGAGYGVAGVSDGREALQLLNRKKFDLMLLDIGLPRMNGLEVLARLRARKTRPKVVVMTVDDTPETLLQAVREQAYRYVKKPFAPNLILELVEGALAVTDTATIEVLSARPNWVELLVPCQLQVAERIEAFLMELKADLPDEVRESVGRAFRELLCNAIEWGGKLDPNRKVRIACLSTPRMLLYRIADPGTGFRLEELTHAAVGNPPDKPLEHVKARNEKGLRPGGFGIQIVRAMVDDLLYNEAQNEVVFVKYLG